MELAHESADSSMMDLPLPRAASQYVHRCLYLLRNSISHILTYFNVFLTLVSQPSSVKWLNLY